MGGPSSAADDRARHNEIKNVFYAVLFVSLTFNVVSLADLGQDISLAWFSIALVAHLIGAIGVKTNNLRLMTLFLVLLFIDFFFGLLRIDKAFQMVRYIIEMTLCHLILTIRKQHMFKWFSTNP